MTMPSTQAAVAVRTTAEAAADRSLIVLDASSPDLQGLRRGARLPLVALADGAAPLASLSELLRIHRAGESPIEVLHLVAHGRPGGVRLAGQWLDASALRAAAADLAGWSVQTIVLWSCQAGLDQDFIATLSELSGASVRASAEVLGHGAALSIDGGAGELHRLTDLFDAGVLAEWSGQLSDTITIADLGLNFSNGIRLTTTPARNPNPVGTLYLYRNVFTDLNTGQSLDALVAIEGMSPNSFVTMVDSDVLQFERSSYFQPNVTFLTTDEDDNPATGGSAKFHFQFIKGGSYAGPLPPVGGAPTLTAAEVAVVNVSAGYDEIRINGATPYEKINVNNLEFTAYDIDGQFNNATARQYVQTTSYDPSSVTLGDTSELSYKEVILPDGTKALRVESLFTGDSNPGAEGSDGFDQADFDAHKASARVGLTDNFDLTVGDYSNTSANYLALYGISFGSVRIGDYVWEDANINGVQDDSESGIAGVVVNLLNSAGRIVATKTTDANGYYLFSDLNSGVYSVQFVAPSGYASTTANQGGDDNLDSDADPITGITQQVTLPLGTRNTSLDAGFYRTASLGDYVWEDSNANGIQDAGESGISGVTVKLLDGSGNDLNITTVTDASGAYGFVGLAPGSYSVQFLAPEGSGYVFSPKGQGGAEEQDSDADVSTGRTAAITLASGQSNLTLDAGLYQGASLGNYVWGDTNANGIQDSGEVGISGVTVRLLDGSGNDLNRTTSTNANGAYSFTGLTPGSYAVQFVAPGVSGYVFSPKGLGSDDDRDSDADVVSGRTDAVTLSAGQTNNSLDAGLVLANTPISTGRPAPGVRTPGFWLNKTWQQFWDGNATNQNSLSQNGTKNFPLGDLLHAPYTNSAEPGKVFDPVTGSYSAGLLIGDFNRNGFADAGEETLFYSLSEARTILDPFSNPDKNDVRYTLSRSLVASWLNYMAGNPVDTAAANDKDARHFIREGVNWLQALTTDENGDRKGDGALSGLNSNVSSPAIAAKSTFWSSDFKASTTRPTPYSNNTDVSFLGGIDSGRSIHTALDSYNNGLGGYADGLFSGGNL